MGGDKVSKILVIFLGQTFNFLLVFLLTPFLARSLSKHDYGTFAQVQLVSTFFVAAFSLGIYKVFYLTLENKSFSQNDALKTIGLLSLFTGVAASILFFLAAPGFRYFFDNPDITRCLRIYAPYFLFYFLNLILEFNLIRLGNVRSSALIIVTSNSIKLGLLLLAIQMLHDFDLIFVTIGIIAPAFQFLMYVYFNKFDKLLKGQFDRKIAIYVLKIGLPLGVTTILATSYQYLSGFYVSWSFPPETFAVYRNGAFEIPFLSLIATSVASIMTPHFAAKIAERKVEEVVQLKSGSITEVAAITYPLLIFVLFFAKELLTLYLSDKYLASVPIFTIYSFILFMRVTSYEDVLSGMGKSKSILSAYCFYFIINISSIVLMGYLFGIMGVAIASVLSIYTLAYLLIKRTAFWLNVQIIDIFNFRRIGEILFWAIVFCSLLKIICHYMPNILLQAACACLYFLFVYYILIRKKLITISYYRKFITMVPFGTKIYDFISR